MGNCMNRNSLKTICFLAAFSIALLTGLSCNLWNYGKQREIMQNGDWHLQMNADNISEKQLTSIEELSTVKDIAGEEVLFIHLYNPADAMQTAKSIEEILAGQPADIRFHDALLSYYFVHPAPILIYMILLLSLILLSLVLIIRTAFSFQMQQDVRSLGMYASAGAGPKQIRTMLMRKIAEAACLPASAGLVLGYGASWILVSIICAYTEKMTGGMAYTFILPLPAVGISILLTIGSIFLSAWLPARKVSRISVLQALKGIPGKENRRCRHPFIKRVFGIEGELGGIFLDQQKHALRLGRLALLFSLCGFSMMLLFLTLSYISTNETYFSRYQDVWDISITLEETQLSKIRQLSDLRALPNVEQATAYEVYSMDMTAKPDQLSSWMQTYMPESIVSSETVSIPVQLVVMDDDSYLRLQEENGIEQNLGQVLVLNRIWDQENSHFRSKQYQPVLDETVNEIFLENGLTVSAAGMIVKTPEIREEFFDGGPVIFIPSSLWKNQDVNASVFINILAENRNDPIQLTQLADEAEQSLQGLSFTIENRIQKKLENDEMFLGMMAFFSLICIWIAAAGLASLYFQIQAFARARTRDLARLVSAGMEPGQMKKMFAAEALYLILTPVVFLVVLLIITVPFLLRLSGIPWNVFIQKAPFIPVLLFAAAAGGIIVFSYRATWKKIRFADITETLRNESQY